MAVILIMFNFIKFAKKKVTPNHSYLQDLNCDNKFATM